MRTEEYTLLVDGNYFKPFSVYDDEKGELKVVSHTTIEKGDSIYSGIAAASILAKHVRDTYILALCEEYPELSTRYHLHTNMGYGTVKHLQGIRDFGITQWHRKSFKPCS